MGTTCSTTTVVSGDSCASLASRCGVTAADFYTYNPSATLCSTLAVGQKVCCTSGGLPVPVQNSDGSCAVYTVVSGDTCSAIALSNSITVANLESWNTKTWGWQGCGNLQLGKICLSTGSPPMPAAVEGTVCGPQVPGTATPPSGTDLSTLNPCPLKACCDIWGQCGTTAEFCTNTTTGAPGTAAPGTNGCISNCGTNVILSSPPAEFRRIGYYEVFNIDRPCLNMAVTQIDTSKYTHVHFAFLELTSDFAVSVNQYRSQFNDFVQLKGVKRIVSFGGWTMSTSPETYAIFRDGVSAANRALLASNLAFFVAEWGLDGVDIDWEYPGEQDIPGIPASSVDDGANLAAFLVQLRTLLGSYSLSIATPASYWYLKAFPIATMAASLDYIVYMTYDLHGQWDYGNAWSDAGCPAGNCLRSHVNITETVNALSMITKAGVPSTKLVIGITSYGRSFKMTTAGCIGPKCTYTGPASGATAGRCTQTAGYIAGAEIDEILAQDPTAQKFFDTDSHSDIMVYDSLQWVAYMSNETKSERVAFYEAFQMGGVSDWAIDLEAFLEPPTPTIPTRPSTPAESSTYTDPISINGGMNPYLRGCNDKQKAMINEAWNEAATLAAAHYEWWPGKTWQDAMTDYLGSKSKDDYSWISGYGPLFKNVENEYAIHWRWWGTRKTNSYAYFYCSEDDVPVKDDPLWSPQCTDRYGNPTDTTAYSWDDTSHWFYYAHYVVFCPLFFSSRMTSLASKVETAQGDSYMQSTINYWRPIRARTMFHETYHWETTVSEPIALDHTYDPDEIFGLALTNQEEAVENAESWALCAMAIYLQKTFHLSSPPIPEEGNSASIAGSELNGLRLSSPPPGWNRPVVENNSIFNPDMTNVVMLEQVGPLNSGTGQPCTNGLWQSEGQCLTLCFDGNCAQSSTNASWVCSDCGVISTTPVCVAGSYVDYDDCEASCSNGLCIENAGVTGIQCEDCPA